MKIIISPDSFKGSMTAKEVCIQAEKAAKEVFKDVIVKKIPVADGGEGTLESIIDSLNGKYIEIETVNPLMEKIKAKYGIFDNDKAIIEMSKASGLTLIKKENRDILKSNTYGTGILLLDAIKNGCKTIYIGLGGSATNDGGIGLANALGCKFLDKNNSEVEAIPQNFKNIENINIGDLKEKLKDIDIIVLSDVKNTLTGEAGATKVFGKQKGASPKDIIFLEAGMKHYIKKVEEALGCNVENSKGSGAAGGLGAGLMAFTNAKIKSGINQILNILNFESEIKDADLVVTGEGRMDFQSAFGKVASGIGAVCKENNVLCIAVVGSVGEGYEDMYNYGINSITTTVDEIMTLDNAINNSKELCYKACVRMFRNIKVGMCINSHLL